MSQTNNDKRMTRRKFLASTAATAGTILAGRAVQSLARAAPTTGAGGAASEVTAAIIGAGAHGMVLLRDALRIPGVRFRAVCDIWKYSQRYASGTVRNAGQPKPNIYMDYREMLDKEKDLQAVIVATPDWMHAEHANAAMKAGLDVYCEKEMSNSLQKAASIVATARQTGCVCQIGHQRRSNPVYQHALELLAKDGICGRITNCYGQWNRSVQEKLSWPKRYEIPADVLAKFGYKSMDHFRNWRWYRQYSAGPISDLGSHQIDVFSWFLKANPESVMAAGGKDYYEASEWYTDMMTIYEYRLGSGSVRAFYQVLNTNGFGRYFERFMGDKGTLAISEHPDKCYYVPEPATEVPQWMAAVARVDRAGHKAIPLIAALSKKSERLSGIMADRRKKTIHQYHLENFFAAVRASKPKAVTCPPSEAYRTAVAVLSALSAVEKGTKRRFKGEEFNV
ncbi:MAG: Gfo/Idh/MocA family protein [Planctomycetota bacterium]|jgi:predicted dehydrogenase